MAKVVKLKQSDIEKIVSNILKEEDLDDFDTKIQPEEIPGEEEYVELTLGKGEDGSFYVMKNADTSNPEVVAKVK